MQLKPLPGLAFGSLTGSGASGAAGQPILNDNAAITEYMNRAAFAINQILGEGIESVQERIANDFAGTDGDHYGVVNPYEGDLISNANLFISQYCAAKNLDFAAISLTDMEQILRAGLTHLYSFSRTMEMRTVPAEENGEEDTAETWYIYTIRYGHISVLRGGRRVRAGLHCADVALPDPVHRRANGGRDRVPRPCVPRFSLWRSRHR